jgi:hypothetical protein
MAVWRDGAKAQNQAKGVRSKERTPLARQDIEEHIGKY